MKAVQREVRRKWGETNKMDLGIPRPSFLLKVARGNSVIQPKLKTPNGSPAHTTLQLNPQTHIARTCTHTNKTRTDILQQRRTTEVINKSQNSALAAIQRLLLDLQIIRVSVYVCRAYLLCHPAWEPTVSSALRDYASASLTTSWIPAPDVWPSHRARKKAVMFTPRNLLEYVCIQGKCCNLTIFRKSRNYWSWSAWFTPGITLFFSVGERNGGRVQLPVRRFHKFRNGTTLVWKLGNMM